MRKSYHCKLRDIRHDQKTRRPTQGRYYDGGSGRLSTRGCSRKLLEQQQAKTQFRYLTFHCDWTVHAQLEGPTAESILDKFDAANLQLRRNVRLQDLPPELRREVELVSNMERLRNELTEFMNANGLSSLEKTRSDAWSHFLQLYTKVVEDCPLVMSAKKHPRTTVEKVTVHIQLATQPVESEMLYKITWRVHDRNGQSGEIFVINSFSTSSS